MSRKIGLHIIGGYSGPLGVPRVVKIVDPSVQAMRDLRDRVGADCLIIVRWYECAQPLVPPEDRAREWFARRVGFMRELRGDTNIAYESYNEVPDSQAALYALFEMVRMDSMHKEGFRAVMGDFSVGCPDLPIWKTYEPMLAKMKAGDLLGLHEYWIDTADINNPWHCARWTLVPQLKDVPIVVTECGRDIVEGKGRPGWQHTCNATTFLLDLGLYGQLLDKFSNVLGATVFQDGSLDPTWSAFDVKDIWDKVVSQYATDPAPTPKPYPPNPVLMGIPVDGRLMSAEQFEQYVKGVELPDVRYVVIHNTVAPDEATWTKWGGWGYWKKRLKEFYEGKTPPWTKGPHLFVGPDGIGLFYDLAKRGRGVGGGYGERAVRHIEIVGNYGKSLPAGMILENAVRAAAAILRQAGLDASSLTTHDRYVGGWDCPGKKLREEFGWFRQLVKEEMETQ